MLPPEINSGRLYIGPGLGPLLAAAAAWDRLAAQLEATGAAYSSTVAGLAEGWQGATYTAMAAAAAPFAEWLDTSAVQAWQTAGQARAAAAAYEAAFAAAVPPPVIATNRGRLAALVATNILGQNTAAIAAAELEYAEMWEQDAAAMYVYARSASAASALTPFHAAPQMTNIGAAAATAAPQPQTLAASSLLPAISQSLYDLSTTTLAAPATPTTTSLSSVLLNLTIGSLSPLNLLSAPTGGELGGLLMYSMAQTGVNFSNVFPVFSEFMQASATSGTISGAVLAGQPVPAVSANMGDAALVSKLSVPQGWVSTAPGIKPAGVLLPTSSPAAAAAVVAGAEEGSLLGSMALSGLAGRAVASTGSDAAKPGKPTSSTTDPTEVATVNIILITEDE